MRRIGQRRYKRREDSKGTIALRTKFFIFTEGETEESYFNNFIQQPDPYVQVVSKADNKRSLVEKVISDREKLIKEGEYNAEVDQTWVVFDRDVNNDKTDKDKFNQAVQIASNHTIFTAVSNDAFELWYLLHFQEVQGAISRDDLISKLESVQSKKYVKGKRNNTYSEIVQDMHVAIKRAKQLEERWKGTPLCDANPSTTVYKLVELIISQPGYRG